MVSFHGRKYETKKKQYDHKRLLKHLLTEFYDFFRSSQIIGLFSGTKLHHVHYCRMQFVILVLKGVTHLIGNKTAVFDHLQLSVLGQPLPYNLLIRPPKKNKDWMMQEV